MFFPSRSSRDNMWHEARKQERKIRGMLVDLKKRAERRKEFYERIKQDPAQFLQLHGRRCKIHIDLAIAQAADSPVTMMPWQGNRDVMIDRFDVRAHLDTIPEFKHSDDGPELTEEQKEEERQINYERYRTLVQNDFLGVSEDKFLHQIFLEERYGPVGKPVGTTEEEKKKLAEKKAAIGYTYEDSTPAPSTSSNQNDEPEEEEDKEDLSDIDLDVTVDVNELTIEQAREMNDQSHAYGMESTDFISYLHLDKEEQERLKQARELEEEKAMYSGRKSRRERRALREKKLKNRKVTSPPSYAARASPTYKPFRAQSSSRSRSRSPQNMGEITFITSFGDEGSDDDDGATKKGHAKAGGPSTAGVGGGASSSGSRAAAASSRGDGGRGSGGFSRRRSRDRSRLGRSRDRHAGSSHGSSRGRLSSRRRSSSSRSSSGGRVRRRSRSRGRASYRSRRGSRRRSRSPRLSSPRHRGRWTSSRSRSRSRSRHWGHGRKRSTSSPRSPKGHDREQRSRSRSSPPPAPRKLPSPPRKSYYRHSLSRSRSKSLSSSDDEEKKKNRSRSNSSSSETSKGQQGSVGAANGTRRNWPSADAVRPNVSVGKPGPASKTPAGASAAAGGGTGGLTLREKLKRKMQAALNKQYKADKRAEREKQDKIQQERWDRAEELRGMALRLRQREREKRHKERDDYDYEPDGSRDGRDGYSSRSGSRSRSQSLSPEPRPPGESSYVPTPPEHARNPAYYSRRRSRSRSRSPPQDYYRSRPPTTSSSSWSSSKALVDY
ncbi:CLK4-associating serine/arginine rich protein isoform X1 [Dermacentor albipictus]|uniref:CLK4-associating serine/arginine rich protein isoform X1 n=1 Tax=Dermacentor albipictus TaxID=60249 RepID=UPI0038FBFB22